MYQAYEVTALRYIREWLPQDAVVTVPMIHLFDDTANVIIMDDCGEDVKTLKQLMIDNLATPDVAQQIGIALGQFLASIHSKGSTDKEKLEYFDGNQQARVISAWATYGRLVSTLTGQNAPASLKDPILDIPAQDIETIGNIAKQTTLEMTTTKETLVMGDFWPGNLMIVLSSDRTSLERIYVLDWELVKPGIAGLDIGQFLAEMHLLRQCRPHCAESASTVIVAFQRSYRIARGVAGMEDVARKAEIHVGAHLVAWTPRNDWGSREKTRELVLKGVSCILSGSGTGEGVERPKAIVGELAG